jgi:hypothetical protein
VRGGRPAGRGVGSFFWSPALGLGASSSSSVIPQIGAVIQQIEGWAPGSLSYQNNNPGNLIFVGQAGAVLGAGGFAKFPTYDAGLQAMYNQIQIFQNNGLTLNQMMGKWAPAGQGTNNPVAYANSIASTVGIDPDTPLADVSAGSSVYSLPSGGSFTDDLTAAFSAPDLSTAAGIVAGDPVLLSVGVLLGGLVLWNLFG